MNYIPNMVRSKGDPRIVRSGPSSMDRTDSLARALGWFSIALGLAELVAADRLARALGMHGREGLIRASGMREIGSGVLTLSTEKRVGLWSRVAGDGLDIAALLAALRRGTGKRDNVGLALALVVGATMLDLQAARATGARHARRRGRVGRDFRGRSGFPGGVSGARGLARRDFETPSELRAEPALARVSDRPRSEAAPKASPG